MFLFLVEGILCGSVGAIGNKSGEGYQSRSTRTKEVLTTAQSATGQLSESHLDHEETTQEEIHAREHRKRIKSNYLYLFLAILDGGAYRYTFVIIINLSTLFIFQYLDSAIARRSEKEAGCILRTKL